MTFLSNRRVKAPHLWCGVSSLDNPITHVVYCYII